jgi:hypothetical protein
MNIKLRQVEVVDKSLKKTWREMGQAGRGWQVLKTGKTGEGHYRSGAALAT